MGDMAGSALHALPRSTGKYVTNVEGRAFQFEKCSEERTCLAKTRKKKN